VKRLRVPITIQDHDLAGHFSQMIGAPRERWPLRFGVPFPKGVLRDPASLAVLDGDRVLPSQFQITNRWPDGSIRWLSALALVDLRVSETKRLFLQSGNPGEHRQSPTPALAAKEQNGSLQLSNGILSIEASRSLDSLILKHSDTVIAASPPTLELQLATDERLRPAWSSARLESDGPLRSRIVYRGHYVAPSGETSFDAEFGVELTARQSWIECFHRVMHKVPGTPSLPVRRLALRQDWELDGAHYVVRQSHRGHEWLPRDVRRAGHVEVRVTGQRAFVTDLDMAGEDAGAYPPYLQKGLDSVEPWLAASASKRTVLFWTPEPLGISPQGWSLDGGTMTIEFIPSWSEPAEFTQGRAKTHRWRWHFTETPPAPSLDQETDPRRCFGSAYNQMALLHALQPIVSVDPAWSRRCKVAGLHRAFVHDPRRYPRFEAAVNHLFDLQWPKGLMNWGDDVDPGYTRNYAATGLKLEGAVWTNNEYDFLYAAIHQMLRTGQGRVWKMVERSAQHALDVDFVHYSDDPWLHHGSPAHSANHTGAASYPSHIWTEGLLHYYYVSGDARALEVARQSGEFILRYLKKRWWVFEETAREAGWALLALTELFAATGERAFLDGARRIKGFVVEGTEKRHPLFPGEASFFIAVLVMGLDKLHEQDGDPKISRTIDRIMQWRLDHRMSPEGIPLYHWDASGRMVNSREIMFPAALAIAHRHTRKKQYLDAMRRCLDYWLDTNTFYGTPQCTKKAASYYRTWIEALQELAGRGLLREREFRTFRNR